MVPVTPILWEKVNIHINVGPIIIETMNLKMANNEECLYGKKYIIVVVVVAVVVVAVVPSINFFKLSSNSNSGTKVLFADTADLNECRVFGEVFAEAESLVTNWPIDLRFNHVLGVDLNQWLHFNVNFRTCFGSNIGSGYVCVGR